MKKTGTGWRGFLTLSLAAALAGGRARGRPGGQPGICQDPGGVGAAAGQHPGI